MAQPGVVILNGVRIAIGTFGGSLKDKPSTELRPRFVREAVKWAAIQPNEVGYVVFVKLCKAR